MVLLFFETMVQLIFETMVQLLFGTMVLLVFETSCFITDDHSLHHQPVSLGCFLVCPCRTSGASCPETFYIAKYSMKQNELDNILNGIKTMKMST